MKSYLMIVVILKSSKITKNNYNKMRFKKKKDHTKMKTNIKM